MAKKTTKPATQSKKPAPTKKATGAKATKKKAPAKKSETIEIELDAVEAKAFELAHASDKVCTELEETVMSAVSDAVRKVYKKNGITLTSDQAQKVALLLFGD